jgi:hypothetical protein
MLYPGNPFPEDLGEFFSEIEQLIPLPTAEESWISLEEQNLHQHTLEEDPDERVPYDGGW